MSTFSEKLKTETKEVHDEVNAVKIMAVIMSKRITKAQYIALLSNYYYMYASMEDAVIANKENEYVKKVFFPVLLRVRGIEEDLAYFLGENWLASPELAKAKIATQEWQNHVTELGKQDPKLLVAHMYTRYLGDLAGGSFIEGKLKSCFTTESLPDKKGEANAGLKFYKFEVDNPRGLVGTFKAGLDGMIVPGDEKATLKLQEELVDEVIKSFHLNIDILGGLVNE